MTQKLYNEERDTDQYDNLVMKHMLAMTAEEMHGKAAIAVELAYRDWQIEQLREALLNAKAMGFFTVTNDSSVTHRDLCKAVDKALEQTK